MKAFAALLFALALAGCATGPSTALVRNDAVFGQVHAGMTQDDVRRLAGPPDEVMPFPLSHTHSWGYYYWDSFGYYVLWSATFSADGQVVSTFSRRLNDGGDHK